MVRYWDLTTKQKSELTQEDIRSLIKIELMEKGVVVPSPPTLVDVQEVVELSQVNVYTVMSRDKYMSRKIVVAFANEKDAIAFTQMNPLAIDYDYSIGSAYKYVRPLVDLSISVDQYYTYADITQMAAMLRERKAALDSNAKAQSEFTKANKIVEEASQDLFEDWHKANATKRRMEVIKRTLDDYIKTAGDRETALKFLNLAFSTAEINEMFNWFEVGDDYN